MKNKLFLFFGLLAFFVQAQNPAKVVCVGASITYGAFIPQRETNSFPGQLQQLLGEDYEVVNYGVNSTTMSRNGNYPYWKTDQYRQALQSMPDIVFIDLGANDSKLLNRNKLDDLKQDSKDMITSFQELPSHPRVILLLPIVSFVTDTTGIWDSVISGTITPKLRGAAYEKQVELIDMRPLLVNHPEMLPDQIHPDAAGSAIMARRLYQVIKQPRDKNFDFEAKFSQDATASSFYGYKTLIFQLNGRECKVVKPKIAAKDTLLSGVPVFGDTNLKPI